MLSGPGVLHKIIESALSDFSAHDPALSAVITLACKAVLAVHVASVRNVKAYRLEDRLFYLDLIGSLFKRIF